MKTTSTNTLPLSEYKSIQILRAIAAILVVLMHLIFFYDDSLKYLGGPTPLMSKFFYFKGFGGVGLQIFFVISGFIMSFLHEKGESANFVEFCFKRITRIAPLYWLITLFWAFVLVGISNVNTARLFHSLFFIPQPDNMTLVGPGWSLNFEMFFYAIFGFCTLNLRKPALYIGVVFLLLNAGFICTGNYLMRLYSDPIVWNFFAGIIIYKIHRWPAIQQESTTILSIAIALLLSSIFWHLADDSKGVRQFLPWGVPSMLIVLGATSMETAKKNIGLFKIKLLLKIGDASYALYLVHGVCFFGVSKILLYTLKVQKFITPDGAILLYLLICCIISLAVHKWIENPLIKFTRKLFGNIYSINTPRFSPIRTNK